MRGASTGASALCTGTIRSLLCIPVVYSNWQRVTTAVCIHVTHDVDCRVDRGIRGPTDRDYDEYLHTDIYALVARAVTAAAAARCGYRHELV